MKRNKYYYKLRTGTAFGLMLIGDAFSMVGVSMANMFIRSDSNNHFMLMFGDLAHKIILLGMKSYMKANKILDQDIDELSAN